MGYIGILLAVTFVFSTAGLFAFVWSLSSKTSQAQRRNAEVSAPANLVGMACASRMTERSIAWRSNWGGSRSGTSNGSIVTRKVSSWSRPMAACWPASRH